ncbi:hypothetical protein BJ138DRAFT_1120498 [Hygrophoropsis aurantiaca]|uniref:Uncharacterized protein n=1 Tax=Hygrophoropsis aurantiaca TaxID=72124 RepID=A0ACB7ZR64_9AGAM|nr:hypothetical protein BJ138DRAFT_1120498 [Hygrophoropsis aurantiaca]
MLNGTSQPTMGALVELIYKNAGHVKHRADDPAPGGSSFISGVSPSVIKHAKSALTTWAVRISADLVKKEAKQMIKSETGLHLRAEPEREHAKRRHAGSHVTWEAISSFSFRKLQDIVEDNAPVMWQIISSYANKNFESAAVYAVRKYRPQNLGTVDSMMELTFLASGRTTLYPICRGVYLFAMKAHKSLFRVESRLGRSVVFETVYKSLRTMAHARLEELKDATRVGSGRYFWVVGDNIQAYSKQRDHRIGRESRMIKGFAGTAIEMKGVNPEAFDVKELVRRQTLQERKQLTVDLILADLDSPHLEKVAALQFLITLIEFVPSLSIHHNELISEFKNIAKNQINPTRHSKIFPLATNSADEIYVQGMKEAVLDFLSTQMNITEETLGGRVTIFSGDGKTFDQLGRLKKFLSMHKGDFDALRFVVPMLELWHTKWTDLSRIVRTHWGGEDTRGDPSTLSCLAGTAECPTPSDLRKVDFYNGAHLVNLALDAHILNIWENYFSCNDLVSYFERLDENQSLPSFEILLRGAHTLARRHASTQAYLRARNPSLGQNHPDEVPLGSPWTNVREPEHMDLEIDALSNGSDEQNNLETLSVLSNAGDAEDGADISLANSTLYIRNGIWWREVCRAVADGDTGRVWEIMKIWIFTFSGSGNPFYSQYLMELYCNFKWEFSEELKKTILDNWVVNLHGEPGRFIEMDLMQEHFNFWLEEMAQHKGKEFEDPYYRFVISMHVYFFLRLKEEMEEAVSLRARSKRHGSPHTNNELRAMMKQLKSAEANLRRPGRNPGFEAQDDFTRGIENLKNGKLDGFIMRTTTHTDIMGVHRSNTLSRTEGDENADTDDATLDVDMIPERADLQAPQIPMYTAVGSLYYQSSVD